MSTIELRTPSTETATEPPIELLKRILAVAELVAKSAAPAADTPIVIAVLHEKTQNEQCAVL